MKLRYLIILLVLFLSTRLTMQAKESKTIGHGVTLNTTNGLTQNGASSLIKDSRGYLWIGTFDGLNRYGGGDILSLKNQIGAQLFQNNRILSIAEDELGRLWIGTEGGVTLYDYDRHIFTQLQDTPEHTSKEIIKIFIDPNGKEAICFSSSSSILKYDMLGGLLQYNELPQNCVIRDVIHFHDDTYILASNQGLLSYSATGGDIQYIADYTPKDIFAVMKMSSNELLVAQHSGVQHITLVNDNTTQLYKVLKRGAMKYASYQISTMTIDSDGSLWMGCRGPGGILFIEDAMTNFGAEPDQTFSNNRISNILIAGNSIWISSLGNGVQQLIVNKADFTCFDDNILMPQLVQLSEDRIMICNAPNLMIYNAYSNQEEKLPFTMDQSLATRYKVIAKDKDDSVWVVSCSNEGAEIHKIVGSQVLKINSELLNKIDKNSIFYPVNAIFDNNNCLWVAYVNNLFRISFDPNGAISDVESIWQHQLLKDIGELSDPRTLYIDQATNKLWVGTSKRGLFSIDLSSAKDSKIEQLKINNYIHENNNLHSLPSNFVSAILRTTDGTLWIGTEQGGLCRTEEQQRDEISFDVSTELDGLSNNVVKSICEDHRGNIWIGTNIGLNCYNVATDRFITYRTIDGLPFENFWYSSMVLCNGDFLFSGVQHLLKFNPKEFYDNSYSLKVNFDELRIFNTEIAPNQEYNGSVVMSHRLMDKDSLNLKYDQNVFAIGVDLIQDQQKMGYNIYYRMMPNSEKWIKLATNNNSIAFNSIEPGCYKLEVCAENSQGDMGEISTLNIIIAPPIWKSSYAYIIYIALLIFAIYVVIYIIISFQSLSHKLQIKNIEKSVSEDKLRYLSNISHELKTPLSLILAPIALLQERFRVDQEVITKLNIVKRQSKKLLELIELIHGVEASDLKTLKLSRSLFSFNSMIEDITKDFEFISKYDNKEFKLYIEESQIIVDADRGMIEKVVNNLLSNALKHTSNNDEIVLSYQKDGDNILLKVTDTGYGIDSVDIPHIFERFYQAKRSGNHNIGGAGIGLAFSKLLVELHDGTIEVESEFSKYTTFTVKLPIISNELLPIKTIEPETNDKEIIYDDSTSEIVIESEYASSLIYLVDDNQELRSLLCEIIERYFNVKFFSNGAEMIASLDTEWPDLIISDVMMPEMDGYEVCRRIKSDIKTSHIPVILLTACTTVDDKIKGLQIGADAYIPKPFYPKHLITRIETLLHNRQVLRERFKIGIPLVYGKDSDTSAMDNEFMRQLYECFEKILSDEDVNLDLIARELGQSRSTFFKKIKRITNTSPYELLKEYRLKRASEMLLTGKYNISEVCMLTGFKGRSHFSRIFKERFNVSPSKYCAIDNKK